MPTTYHTAAELRTLIRKQPAGTMFLFSIRNDSTVVMQECESHPRKRRHGLSGYVDITRAAAMKFAQQLELPDDERVPVRTNDGRNDFWIGA